MVAGDLFSTLQDNRNPSIKRCKWILNDACEFGRIERLFELVLSSEVCLLELRGLKVEVKIYGDNWGVPHIYAENEDDLFFARGVQAW